MVDTLLSRIEGIKTVTPGVISKTKGRGGKLHLRITSKINNGYKLLARKGSSTQEVFVITNLEIDMMQSIIENEIRLK